MSPKRHLQPSDGNAKLPKRPRTSSSVCKEHVLSKSQSRAVSKRDTPEANVQEFEAPPPSSNALAVVSTESHVRDIHPQITTPSETASSDILAPPVISNKSNVADNSLLQPRSLSSRVVSEECCVNELAATNTRRSVGVDKNGRKAHQLYSEEIPPCPNQSRPSSAGFRWRALFVFSAMLLVLAMAGLWVLMAHRLSPQCQNYQRQWQEAQREISRTQQLLKEETASHKESNEDLRNELLRLREELRLEMKETDSCQVSLYKRETEMGLLQNESQEGRDDILELKNTLVATQADLATCERDLEDLRMQNSIWKERLAKQELVSLEALDTVGKLSANRYLQAKRRLDLLESDMTKHQDAAIEAVNFVALTVASKYGKDNQVCTIETSTMT